MTNDRIEAAGKRRAAARSRPRSFQSAPRRVVILTPPPRSDAEELAQALNHKHRRPFLRLASKIANNAADLSAAELLPFMGTGFIHWSPKSPPMFAVLTEEGVDVGLALLDMIEAEDRAVAFAQLIPRRQDEALLAGPCPCCGRPLVMTGLFMCSDCLKRAPKEFRRAAAAASRHPWAGSGGNLDGGWRTVGAKPRARPAPDLHQRTAELACIIAARLGLALP